MSDLSPDSDSASPDRDFYLKLADRASQRFESRRSMEWRTNIVLWTLLAGGSALVLSMRWGPSWVLARVILILGVAVWLWYSFVWLRYLAESFERESKSASFWERAAIKTGSSFELPKTLLAESGSEPSGPWPDPGESDESAEYLTERTWKKPVKLFLSYHTAQKTEVLLTALLILLLSIFLFVRASVWRP